MQKMLKTIDWVRSLRRQRSPREGAQHSDVVEEKVSGKERRTRGGGRQAAQKGGCFGEGALTGQGLRVSERRAV